MKLNFLIILLVLSTMVACQSDFSQPPLPTIVGPKPTADTVKPAEPTSTSAADEATPEIAEDSSAILDTPSPPVPPLEQINLALELVTGGFEKPLYLTHAGDQTNRLFVVEQAGRIWIVENGTRLAEPFMDIVNIVGSSANEQGLLSVAFHPSYVNNGQFFVNYTNRDGDTVIARYQRSSDNPNRADGASQAVLLTIAQPYGNHNGGHILFGPDGYLYIGMGDGGAANDPHNYGQDVSHLLGKILRIDVDNGSPYGVPADNPFVSVDDARPEIWSYGWRNPWRIAFDASTQDMYVADVGQNQFEEVHVEFAHNPGGDNYGWRLMEGNHCFNPTDCTPATLNVVLPIAEYDHAQGCSVTGGYVYRGAAFPALGGTYLYGDYCTGLIWGIRSAGDGSWEHQLLLQSDLIISSFGQDEAGELYLIEHRSGDIFRITAS